MSPSAIVQKLWNYCNVLRDDGMSYGHYVEQLTYLLFLKMADERTKPPYNRSGPIHLNSSQSFLSGVSADSHAASLPVGSITA